MSDLLLAQTVLVVQTLEDFNTYKHRITDSTLLVELELTADIILLMDMMKTMLIRTGDIDPAMSLATLISPRCIKLDNAIKNALKAATEQMLKS